MTIKINDDALRRAIDKWESQVPIEILLSVTALKEHMLKENGIEIGSWVGLNNPKVVDEKKYITFLLKYGS